MIKPFLKSHILKILNHFDYQLHDFKNYTPLD